MQLSFKHMIIFSLLAGVSENKLGDLYILNAMKASFVGDDHKK